MDKQVLSRAALIVERSDDELWGRVRIKGNLVTEVAPSLSVLKSRLKKVILDFEEIDIKEFDISYDLTSFFEQNAYLNISEIAIEAGISPALMRQYAAGIKFPSEERIREIEKAIREIGKRLARVRLHKSSHGAESRKKMKPLK
jgi:hypothetical protein